MAKRKIELTVDNALQIYRLWNQKGLKQKEISAETGLTIGQISGAKNAFKKHGAPLPEKWGSKRNVVVEAIKILREKGELQ